MTKEQFEQEMVKYVLYYKDKLEHAELGRSTLPNDMVDKFNKVTYNPFLKFDKKYFNSNILSNLQGLDYMMYKHKEMSVDEIYICIISNSNLKILNELINYNPCLISELKEKIQSPMSIAIDYAIDCERCHKLTTVCRH